MVSIDAAVGAVLALIHRWNLAQFLYNWQTLIAGVLAVLAAWRTIRATVESAALEVKASQEQTAVAQKQTETTRSFGAGTRRKRIRRISHHARSGDVARHRRGGLGQKGLSEPFGAESWLLGRRPYRSPVHHQRRVRGVAWRLRHCGAALGLATFSTSKARSTTSRCKLKITSATLA
jgi:hypothetical protein